MAAAAGRPQSCLVRLGGGGWGVGRGFFLFSCSSLYYFSHCLTSICCPFLAQYPSFLWLSYISAPFSFPPSICLILSLLVLLRLIVLQGIISSACHHRQIPFQPFMKPLYVSCDNVSYLTVWFSLFSLCVLVADESNMGSLVGQRNGKCLISSKQSSFTHTHKYK